MCHVLCVITLYKMTLDKMTLDKMTRQNNFKQNGYRQNDFRRRHAASWNPKCFIVGVFECLVGVL